MQLGEGRESRGRWGGYVERLGGPKEAGWGGGDGGASPGKREGGKAGAERGSGSREAVSSQHASPATTGGRHLLLPLPQPCRPVQALHMA